MKNDIPIDSRTKEANDNCDLQPSWRGAAIKHLGPEHDQLVIGNRPDAGTYVTSSEIAAYSDAQAAKIRVEQLRAQGLLR